MPGGKLRCLNEPWDPSLLLRGLICQAYVLAKSLNIKDKEFLGLFYSAIDKLEHAALIQTSTQYLSQLDRVRKIASMPKRRAAIKDIRDEILSLHYRSNQVLQSSRDDRAYPHEAKELIRLIKRGNPDPIRRFGQKYASEHNVSELNGLLNRVIKINPFLASDYFRPILLSWNLEQMLRRKCGAKSYESVEDRLARRTRQRGILRDLGISHKDADTIYVNIEYVVVYSTDSENIPIETIRAQHKMLNMIYSGQNSALEKVPSSGRYAFSSVIGNPNICFLPENESDVRDSSVTRFETTTRFSGLDEALAYVVSKGFSPRTGVTTVIMCPLDGILGEGTIGGAITAVEVQSVGSDDNLGSMSMFNRGYTAAHEVGHLLTLIHPFDADKCTQVESDMPSCCNPNYTFEFATAEDGSRDGRLCNRYRDCKIYRDGDTSYTVSSSDPPYSCFSCKTETTGCTSCDTSLFEMGMNIMDYATDENMAMFSVEQCNSMREALLSGQIGIHVVKYTGTTATPTADSSGEDAKHSSGLKTWEIGVIAAVSVVAAIMLALILWLLLRKK